MGSPAVDLVVVGSCMIDLVSYTPRLPNPGETLHGHKFAIGFGGKGANQCVAAARLGANTAMVARVGEDSFGKDYIANFKKNDVKTDFVLTTSGVATGAASICVEQSGQNSIIIVAGANLKLTSDDVDAAVSLIGSAKLVVCQLETEVGTTLHALKVARKAGVRTILNAAPGMSNLPNEIFKHTDILCVNETEAELMTGIPANTTDGARRAAADLIRRGSATVILTLGKEGALLVNKEAPQGIVVSARQVECVDSTGAGDAFVGALAYYLCKQPGLSLEEMMRRSCEIATCTVLKEGTQTSFPQRADLPPSLFH